jgi:hypothetical protein
MLAFRSKPPFYPRPVLAAPSLDGLWVRLTGPLLRLLTSPTQTMQQRSNIVRVVLHSQSSLHHLCHPCTGPQVIWVTGINGTAQEDAEQLFPLLRIQPRPRARVWPGLQCVHPTPLQCIFPSLHRGGRCLNHLGDAGQGSSLRKVLCRQAAAILQLFSTTFGSHGSSSVENPKQRTLPSLPELPGLLWNSTRPRGQIPFAT